MQKLKTMSELLHAMQGENVQRKRNTAPDCGAQGCKAAQLKAARLNAAGLRAARLKTARLMLLGSRLPLSGN